MDIRRVVFKILLRCLAALTIVLLCLLGYALGPALYHRYYLFPKQQQAIRAMQDQRRETPPLPGWKELVAACHVHSQISHDCEAAPEEILLAAKTAGVDAVLWSDHPVARKVDYAIQWTGIHDGIRFLRGYEMRYGFIPWGLPETAVLDADLPPAQLARQIRQLGGLLVLAHIEEPRQWELPELAGLEIYNIHAAFKKRSLYRLVPDILLNGASYPDLTLRLVFETPFSNLERWDRLSRDRKLVGFAGNDAHQNSGLRGYYTAQDTFKLTTTGPREIAGEWRLNAVTRWLLRMLYGPLQTDRPLFRYEADRYSTMMRHVNTHLLVRDEQENSLLEALRCGRAFVAFNHLASARGFRFWAEVPGPSGVQYAVMGEAASWRPGARLRAESPMPCRFRLLKEGRLIRQAMGPSWSAEIDQPGQYRLEAELQFLDAWVPWIYANPIVLSAAQ